VPERDQKTREALHRVSPELASQHDRNFSLIDAHELCRGCLGQLSLVDGPVDPNHSPAFIKCSPASGTPRSANTLPELGSCSRRALKVPIRFCRSQQHLSHQQRIRSAVNDRIGIEPGD
jgi:hypothetical protein